MVRRTVETGDGSMRFARIIVATACAFALLPPLSSAAATRNVDIPGRYFTPQRVTITVGSSVLWTNSSGDRHSVTSMSSSKERFTSSENCPGGLLFNDCLRSGATYQHTFSRTGTFDYFCKIHGNQGAYPDCGMCGRVTVKKKGGGIVPTTPPSSSPTTTASSMSPSPSPTISETSVVSPTGTNVAAGPDEGTGTSTLLAIAAVAVALLGGTGIVVYRTMIRRSA
jgi:plastocyanin